MSALRDRAKEHFPMVLLTLLSIVQALALELLWSHVREANYLLELSWTTAIAWLQIASTFTGLVLIWVVYASNAMRFRWVPVTSDSVYPFFIGVLEFMLVETLGPGDTGQWLILMGLVYGLMVRVSHKTMQRARHDGDNDAFFKNFAPATSRDFVPQIATVCALALAGTYLWVSGDSGIFAVTVVLATFGVLGWQFRAAAQFWGRTVVDQPDD
jgi:hypothetical protein